uniref:TEP1-F n=1 Tax=Glossina brevipalpis TaxID=37001 RepID=A0A1A9W1S3_9MUSC
MFYIKYSSLTLIIIWVHFCAGQGLYSIIAPNTLRPNSQYHVAVSIHKASGPVKVQVGIVGSAYSELKVIEVRPYSTELVQFEIPALKYDRYKLTAEGLTGINFANETQLYFDHKQHTVLVQTDKAIYKPSDLVQYRILIMDANLKPARNYPKVRIILRDSGDNIIQSYRDIQLISGVYANDLLLADYPKFGEWSIEVQVGDETYKRSFEVIEYILPKFVIDINTEKHIIYKDNKISATIKAYYMFGKPIVGEATLSIYPTFFGSLQPFVNDLITRKVVPIDGSAYFEFDIRNELKLKEDYEREYLLDALVEETSTGSVQNFSTVITVHLDAYKVEAIKLPRYYIPGIPFDVTVRITPNTASKRKDLKTELTAYLTNVYGSSEIYNKSTYDLDEHSEAKMKFTVPAGDRDEYHSVIIAFLMDNTDRLYGHYDRYRQSANSVINQEISVTVRCSEPMKYFIYQLVGRGDILLSRSVEVSDNTQHTFKFLATFAMMPRAKLLIYTVINGELVYDEQDVELEQNLLNNVQLTTASNVPPGQDIDISITAKPYNYIGLMVVDENAINLRRGSDLSIENLMTALNDYELNDVNTPINTPGKLSGVITLTNADFWPVRESVTTMENSIYDEDHKLTTIRKTDIGPAHTIEVNTLAPGKGRFAFSYTPKPFWHNPRIHVMHPPANTWLFVNVTASNEESTIIRSRVPNSMSTWVLTAFGIDPVQGIGLVQPPKILKASKNFYIKNELPYSVKLGETIALPFVVVNNGDDDLNIDVTFYNIAQEFEFPQVNEKTTPKSKVELYSRRTLNVPSKSSKTVAFIVAPKRVGSLTVKAVAANDLVTDTVESTLLVEYPGSTEIVNHGFLFGLEARNERDVNVSVRIPRNSIKESAKIEISATGDLLGSILDNPENLIYQPIGCGEHAMIKFMPHLMVLKYLQNSGKLTPPLETSAKNSLRLGYQRLLYYRHKNGAFSAFGLTEKKSSTWLTAYVAKAFSIASEFIEIDENILQTALNYLISVQSANGSFDEQGDEFEQFRDNGVSLSAFVTLALMENLGRYSSYKNHINKALDFLTLSLDTTDNLHSLAIGTYVLTKANHNAKAAFLQRLDARAVNEDGTKWWNKTAPASDSYSPWYNRTRNLNVEISSYAILALLENNLVSETLPAVKWLVTQRNDLGGFVGSQDTVVALQALINFAEKFSSQTTNLQLSFNYGQNAVTTLTVNAENALRLQNYELPNNIKNITISASGTGIALAQVTYRYNTNVTRAWPRFVLDPTVNRNSHSDYLHLSACTSFIPAEGGADRSNMAVMEINLPSGFVVDTDTLPTLESSERIKVFNNIAEKEKENRKVETQKRNTVVIIYFDYLDRREVCPTLHAYKTVKVTNHKPVPVIMYDYYDNVRRARQFYRAPKSQICDICEYANCGATCQKAEKRESNGIDGDINDLLNESSNSLAVIKMPNFYLTAINTALILLIIKS